MRKVFCVILMLAGLTACTPPSEPHAIQFLQKKYSTADIYKSNPQTYLVRNKSNEVIKVTFQLTGDYTNVVIDTEVILWPSRPNEISLPAVEE